MKPTSPRIEVNSLPLFPNYEIAKELFLYNFNLSLSKNDFKNITETTDKDKRTENKIFWLMALTVVLIEDYIKCITNTIQTKTGIFQVPLWYKCRGAITIHIKLRKRIGKNNNL